MTNFNTQKERIAELGERLASLLKQDESSNEMTYAQLLRRRYELCAQFDVPRWFVSPEYGGFGFSAEDLLNGYLKLSSACLSTAFVLTQWAGAVSRIASSDNESLKSEILPKMADGSIFSTVGISHLTTSRQHLSKPVLVAEKAAGRFRLNGFSPWVTGVSIADYVVTGASMDEGQEILLLVPTDQIGIS